MSKELQHLKQTSDTMKAMCEYYGIKPSQCNIDVYNRHDIRAMLTKTLHTPEK